MWLRLQQLLLLGYASILCNGNLATQDTGALFGLNAEYSSVCYTYVTSYPVLVTDDEYITITRQHTGTVTITQTIEANGDNPGAIIIQEPATSSPGGSGQGGQAITIPPSGADNPYVIVIQPYTGTGVITAPVTNVVPPSGTAPGTVFIQPPAGSDGSPGSPESGGYNGQPFTLQPTDPDGYVTVFRPIDGTATGTTPFKVTIPPSGTNQGSVIIQTPILTGEYFPAPVAFTIPPADKTGFYTIFEPIQGTGTAPRKSVV